MSAVQAGDFPLLIKRNIGSDKDGKAGAPEGEYLVYGFVALYCPEAERLCCIKQIVLIAVLGVVARGVLFREARDDAVDQGGAECILFVQPCLKAFSEAPVPAILYKTLFQCLSVMLDQLTGHQDKAGGVIHAALAVALIEEAAELPRIRGGAYRIKAVRIAEGYARLRSVADNKLQLGIKGAFEDLIKLIRAAQAAGYHAYQPTLLYGFAVFDSAQI